MNAAITRSAMFSVITKSSAMSVCSRFFYIAPQLKQMELDADCCAVKLLKSLHETDSIEAGKAKDDRVWR